MREKEGYRDTLEGILGVTDGRHLLNIKDVMNYTGKCRNTVKKNYPFVNGEITAERLARYLVGGKR